MTQRRAPSGGYDFAEKEKYREFVWSGIRQGLMGDTKRAHVLLMPSIEGTEIEVALAHGFSEDHLHVVDSNPAIVATLKRRYPKINTHGVTASKACERIAANGIRLDAANFDFTACLSESLLSEMSAILASGAFYHRALIAATMLRGREHPNVFRIIRHAQQTLGGDFSLRRHLHSHIAGERPITPVDAWRIFHLFLMPDYKSPARLFDFVRCGAYLSPSAGQTMLWCLARLIDLKQAHNTLLDASRSRASRARIANVLEFREVPVADRAFRAYEDFCDVWRSFAESVGSAEAAATFAQAGAHARHARASAKRTRGIIVPEMLTA